MQAASWSAFAPYGWLHLVTVATCILLIAAVSAAGRRMRGRPAEIAWRRTLAVSALLTWIGSYALWNWKAFDPYEGLPLHICGLLGVIAPLALLTSNRWLRATMYFWTFTLTLQAFVQPVLILGPATPQFWMFWALHSLIVACAVYDLAVLGFRPDWSDLGRSAAVSAGYIAIVIPIDLWIGANYGFVGDPPPERSLPPLIEYFGPWPGRVLVVIGLTMLGYLIALLPWVLRFARHGTGRDGFAADGSRA